MSSKLPLMSAVISSLWSGRSKVIRNSFPPGRKPPLMSRLILSSA